MFIAITTISALLCFQVPEKLLRDWQEFSPEGGGFRVKMPGAPSTTTRTIETPSGVVKITYYGIEREKTTFLVIRSELPPDTVAKDPKEVLDEARENGVRNSGGTLGEEKEIELDGKPGREMLLDLPPAKASGGRIYRARVYLVGRTHFQVITLAPKSQENPGEMKAFLDSFRLKSDLPPTSARADDAPDGPTRIFKDELIENLVGDWNLTRKVRGKEVANKVKAAWVLNHQFLQVHMVDVADPPAYEAIVLIGYSFAGKKYVAHWCDTYGGKFSAMGYGKRTGEMIEFEFSYPDGPFYNTFNWDAKAKEWTFRMENQGKDGKRVLFAEDRLRR